MGTYLDQIKGLWEKAACDRDGRKEISQYDQVVDFLVTDEGRLLERFQIETIKGRLRFCDDTSLTSRPQEQVFVLDVEKGGFDRLF